MTIHFPPQAAFDFDTETVVFPVEVDGALCRGVISLEALHDHFGLASRHAGDALAAFEASRPMIEAKVRAVYGAAARGDLRLGTNSF